MKIAAETKSSVLASNAVHQRADSLMSMVTVVAILGSNIFKDTAWIDSVGGLCISAIVIRAALENLTKTIKTWKSAD
jgi:divalent metal cation (Fe/Co/Zn/Cd) transporter